MPTEINDPDSPIDFRKIDLTSAPAPTPTNFPGETTGVAPTPTDFPSNAVK